MGISTNKQGFSAIKFLVFIFIAGVFALSFALYAFFSGGNEKIEAGNLKADSTTKNGEIVIVVSEKGFKPNNLSVKPGSQVKWINEGVQTHSISFRLSTNIENMSAVDQKINSGESMTFKFEKPGDFAYFDRSSIASGRIEVK